MTKRHRSFEALTALMVLAAGAVAWFPEWATAQATGEKAPSLMTPKAVADGTARMTGHYESSRMLRLAFALKPPHPDEERQLIDELHDKNSPNFHNFLTAEEWRARFAPSAQDEQALVDWAQSQGFTITQRYSHRLLVDVEATAGSIEKALNIKINNYQLGSASFFSNDREPLLPSHLAGVVGTVLGLNSLEQERPVSKRRTVPARPDYLSGPAKAASGSGHGDANRSKLPASLKGSKGSLSNFTAGAYDPTDIYSSEAYDFNALYAQGHCCNPLGNPGQSPPETSIAIATFDSTNLSDIQGFHNQYPYLAYNVQLYDIDGAPTFPPGEGTMDIEWSTAMSNSFGSYIDTSKVYAYQGANYLNVTITDVYSHMLNDAFARVFSTSWYCTEFATYGSGEDCSTGTMNARDSIFQSMILQGWTLVAASGDAGATSGCGPADAVQFPSTDPNVVAAGGTTLSLSAGPVFNSEVAWSGGPDGCGANDGGSTGGFSAYWSTPSYQSPLGFGSRAVPDIALNADWYNTPQNLYLGGALQPNGGTSIVAPEMAGFFAQENAYLLTLGNICGSGSSPCSPMGNANYYIYDAGIYNTESHNPFYDIVSGCNNNDITAFYGLGYYCAGGGYDEVTGWGSANMLQLAWAINWFSTPNFGSASVSFSGPAPNKWYNTDQIVSWTVSDSSNTGVAGFTQGWDSIPADPKSEATPGSGNSFYFGPQYPNATSGCLEFTSLSCAGGVSQGWHEVHVEAWNNMGVPSGDVTYGPIGYDTIAPVTTAHVTGTLISGTTYKSAVTVTLTSTDPGAPTTGSGVASTVYQVNSEGSHTYSGPFTVSFPGTYTVTFHSSDVAGNVETTKSVTFSISSVISLSPGSLAFGNQPFGTTSAAKSVTLTNIGSGSVTINSILPSGDFAVPTNTCTSTLVGGAHCTITVTFKPSVTGPVTGDVTVKYGGEGSPQREGLTGTGLGPITLSPTSLAFGTITVGSTSAAKTVTLTNNEATSLSISHTASGDYSIASTTCGATLASKASCTMNVTFHPKQNGTTNGAVTVTYNASLSPREVALSGSGTGGVASPLTFTPSSLSFGNVAVGTSATKTVTVKNSSASSVTISNVAASGDYTATGCGTTLAPLVTCTMTVTFKPSFKGTVNGSAAIIDNTIVSPEIYDVSGTGVSPLAASPTSLSFGTHTVGTTSAAQTVTLTNNLGSALSLADSASGDYAIAGGTCGATLAAHASCTLSVTFTPTATGAVTGVVTVTYGNIFSPEEVTLNGTGE